MRTSERRISQRFKLRTPMAFHRLGSLFEGECLVRCINISSEGIFFATRLRLTVGERLELTLEVPKRITGARTAQYRRFTGRVARVVSNLPQGFLGIGVQLICYETPPEEPPLSEAA
ncbi:MAG: PilZ domain-containing protein [Candidatus Acidiferrales bacterium]